MRNTWLIIILACTALLARGQAPSPPQPPPSPAANAKPVEMLDHWRRATIALGIVVQDGNTSKFVTLGSAIIVALDSHRAALLTAKHIVINPDTGRMTPALWMKFPSVDGEDEAPIMLTLFDVQGHNVWRTP